MFDTVKFVLFAPLREPGARDNPLPGGIRCWVDPTGKYLVAVECSLPKLLYGYNGRLISTPEEMARALGLLWDQVSTIAEVPDLGDWKPNRVDLVWQVEGVEAGKVIDALGQYRFPGIQNPPLHVSGQTVTWKGAKSRFVVSAYDKAKQMRVEGDVLRLEVRLCGQILRKYLAGKNWRHFADLYAIYREVIMSLPELPKASTQHSWLSAVVEICGVEAAERVVLVMARNPETLRKYRRAIHTINAKLPAPICWAELFPADGPPSPVTVERPQRTPRSRRSAPFGTKFVPRFWLRPNAEFGAPFQTDSINPNEINAISHPTSR